MGEVYQATDTNLKREVALKVLPASVASDAVRLARFQREAEVLAALNHPNIAAIYGLEKSDGIIALVMELVEGDDLSQCIAKGAIPIDEALPIAKQIADALEAAHEQGIIHRDLKPANIKVRADGTVKVLDFGLAKAMEPAAGSSPSMTQSPTLTTPAMTQAGMILGTAAYMAPEQAKGRTVDRRADVWAFGAVLFEMLTGKRAFPGEDLTDTLAAVVRAEPNWTLLPSGLSSSLVTYIRRCLHKDPKQRIPDIAAMRLALEGAFETAASSPVGAAPLPARGTPIAWMVALAVAGLGMIALAVPAGRHLRETPSVLQETRVDIVTPVSDDPISFALSPDGRQIVFVASVDGGPRLWLRSLATTAAQPLPGTEGASFPFWSPDGRSIGFFAVQSLKRLDLGGAAPRALASVTGVGGGTWGAKGVIVFSSSNGGSPVMRISATGGPAVAVTSLGSQTSQRMPWFLPDGERFLFYAQGTPDAAGIFLGALDGRHPTRLTPADGSPAILPSGWMLWTRGATLVAQRLDTEHGVLTGEPATLAEGVAIDSRFSRSALSVSATGLIAYRTGIASRRQLMWFDRSGAAQGTVGEADGDGLETPRLAPDGRRVAAGRALQGNQDLWLLDGARLSRITFDAGGDRFPIWSPDGTRIAFMSNRSGPQDLYTKLTNGTGTDERLVASDQTKIPTSWSADGRFLIYHSLDPQTNADLWVVPVTGDRTPRVFLKTPFRDAWGTFSPDTRWIAYQSNESGRPEIYVRAFVPASTEASADKPAPSRHGSADTLRPGSGQASGGQWQVSTAGGVFPVWRPDGKELYFLDPSGALMAAPISGVGGALEPGAPARLFQTRIVGGAAGNQLDRQYDVAPDGRFLINTELEGAAAPITLIQNWRPPADK